MPFPSFPCIYGAHGNRTLGYPNITSLFVRIQKNACLAEDFMFMSSDMTHWHLDVTTAKNAAINERAITIELSRSAREIQTRVVTRCVTRRARSNRSSRAYMLLLARAGSSRYIAIVYREIIIHPHRGGGIRRTKLAMRETSRSLRLCEVRDAPWRRQFFRYASADSYNDDRSGDQHVAHKNRRQIGGDDKLEEMRERCEALRGNIADSDSLTPSINFPGHVFYLFKQRMRT